MISAKVILDSVSESGARLITMELKYPRFVHAELMTHRAFCLDKDSILEFEPPEETSGKRRANKMSIGDFVNKWHNGSRKHAASRFVERDISHIDKKKIYTAGELSRSLGYSNPSSIRNACRSGGIQVLNKIKKKEDDFRILGESFILWQKNRGTRSYSLRSRLLKMKIRQLNENTGLIQTSTVTDCCYSGKKEVFKLSAGDFSISGSKDHRILTTAGWKPIGEIKVGVDSIITKAFGKRDEDILDESRLKKINGRWKSTYLNQIRKDKVKDQNYKCDNCSSKLKMRAIDLHHKVPVHINEEMAFDYDNIVALCKGCHRNAHKTQGWQGGTYLYGKPTLVTNIRSVGLRDTFDLSIAGEFANFIADGVVVHNSRNAASSRAIPIKKVINAVSDDPAIPVFWGKNKRGMSPIEEVEDTPAAMRAWLEARDSAIEHAIKLSKLGLHKQIVNRLLEPFQYIVVICTATQWSNFFALRDHQDAQQEIALLAKKMRRSQEQSTPVERLWHMPYIQNAEQHMDNETLKKMSVARCARVSYLTHDGKRDVNKDLILHERLLTGGSHGHWSPFEHVAMAASSKTTRSGNFEGWLQYRKTHGGECQ